MLWPEMDAAYMTSGRGGLPAAGRRPVVFIAAGRADRVWGYRHQGGGSAAVQPFAVSCMGLGRIRRALRPRRDFDPHRITGSGVMPIYAEPEDSSRR
jgi:hypothetical protein